MRITKERQYVVESKSNAGAQRIAFGTRHMPQNKAYQHAAAHAGGDKGGEILKQFKDRFVAYRRGWRDNPQRAIDLRLHGERFREQGFPPLSIDIETAAFCDLACPFCFRQYIPTPDQLMDEKLFHRLVDQAAAMGVPSIKLNWRGEPLAHPRLPQFIDYAKRAGILEVLMNTNAVTLTENRARAIIDAGLDMLIYSFDGGVKETYEKMRVGRFSKNRFEDVYAKIVRFHELREEMGAVFPRTKIQMILTKDTFEEQEQFFKLFESCVDDVSVKAYTERGGHIADLDAQSIQRVRSAIGHLDLDEQEATYWRSFDGEIHVAIGRLPCEQPYQRMMVTCDGRVSMCCYDWGSEYPIGYADQRAIDIADHEYQRVLDKSQKKVKGYELMQYKQMPQRYVHPEPRVQTLEEIWYGPIVDDVRRRHVNGDVAGVPVCAGCPFKETYRWVAI